MPTYPIVRLFERNDRIIEMRKNGLSEKEIAEKTNLTRSRISQICSPKIVHWRDFGLVKWRCRKCGGSCELIEENKRYYAHCINCGRERRLR